MTDPVTLDRSAREQAMIAFVAEAGWPPQTLEPLAADASTRRYFRVADGARRAVLMDAPPGAEEAACPPGADEDARRTLGYNACARLAGPDSRPFVALSDHLCALGFSAPRVLYDDVVQGFLLLEDLGDGLYARVIEQGTPARPLYEAAVDLLVALHARPAPADLPVRDKTARPLLTYDRLALESETRIMLDWYPAAAGAKPPPDAGAQLAAAWDAILPQAIAPEPVLVLRDYHAENLIWLPERAGLARVGLLDFQDALAGHPAYDLVSLLTDARRDVAPDLAAAMRERYLSARAGEPNFDAEAYRTAYAILSVQRNTKILGIFARLWKRFGKPGYLRHVPRVWRYLETDLAHEALAPVRAWYDRFVPPPLRGDALARAYTASQEPAR